MLYVDARLSLPDNLLLYGDKMSMAASLEGVCPVFGFGINGVDRMCAIPFEDTRTNPKIFTKAGYQHVGTTRDHSTKKNRIYYPY